MPNDKILALTAECPECEAVVTFSSMPRLGQKETCPACGTLLEVAFLRPIMLDWADENAPAEYEEDFDE